MDDPHILHHLGSPASGFLSGLANGSIGWRSEVRGEPCWRILVSPCFSTAPLHTLLLTTLAGCWPLPGPALTKLRNSDFSPCSLGMGMGMSITCHYCQSLWAPMSLVGSLTPAKTFVHYPAENVLYFTLGTWLIYSVICFLEKPLKSHSLLIFISKASLFKEYFTHTYFCSHVSFLHFLGS